MTLPIVLVIAVIAALVWVGVKYGSARATPIAPDDPLWQAAVTRARATIPEMRRLQQEGAEVWVKFRVHTTAGTAEHVWGRAAATTGGSLQCVIETPPLAGPATAAHGSVDVAIDDIEDWQVQLADGTIRGGFTTRAQVEIARRDGEPVPRHVEDMMRRMKD